MSYTLAGAEKAARDAQARADAIDAAVYDFQGGKPANAYRARQSNLGGDHRIDREPWPAR
jgi:hypothetical protein